MEKDNETLREFQSQVAANERERKKKEEKILELREKLVTLCNKSEQLLNSADNMNRKTALLKLNASTLEDSSLHCAHLLNTANELLICSKSNKEGGTGESRSKEIMAKLTKCHAQLSQLEQRGREHGKKSSAADSLYLEERNDVLAFILKCMAPYSAVERLEAAVQAQRDLNQQVQEQTRNVDLQTDARKLREEMLKCGKPVNRTGVMQLAARHLLQSLEADKRRAQNVSKLNRIAEQRDKQVQMLLKTVDEGVNEVMCRKWLDGKLKLKYRSLMEETLQEQLKELQSTFDLKYYRWHIQQGKKAALTFNVEKDRLVHSIQQDVMQILAVPALLTTAQSKVIAKLNSFNSSCMEKIESSSNQLQGCVDKEVGAFMELLLEALHHVTLANGETVPSYELPTMYHTMLPADGLVTLLGDGFLAPVHNIVMNLFERLQYYRYMDKAAQTFEIVQGPTIHEEMFESDALDNEITDASTLCAKRIESLNKAVKLISYFWATHPFTEAVPTNMMVNGLTLEAYQNRFSHSVVDEETLREWEEFLATNYAFVSD